MKKNRLIFKNGEDWTFPMLEQIEELGHKYMAELGFDYYPLQIEIVSAEHMLGLYTSGAMPINYNHWSFGEEYLQDRNAFYSGKKGLAFEICKNTNPCLCYNMETNTSVDQASVIFHVYGHSSHFASNYLYKTNSQAELLVPYMEYARNFIQKCEQKYGVIAVEHILDLAHSVKYSSVNKYKRFSQDENRKMLERELYLISSQNYLLDKLNTNKNVKPIYLDPENVHSKSIKLPEENILYFIEKNSPILTNWEREICKIIRHLAQFSYQNLSGQSQILAEGTAMFTECYMMKRAFDDGYIDQGSYLEYLNMNSWVLYQTEITKKVKNPYQYIPQVRLNPYFLGLHILRDIRRMCECPTEDDLNFNPEICGSDWKLTIKNAISNYRDDSLIRQFLSPFLIKKLKLMHTKFDNKDPQYYTVESHAEYTDDIRSALANINTLGNYIPDVEITSYDGDSMIITYNQILERNLNKKAADETCDCIAELMGCVVDLVYN